MIVRPLALVCEGRNLSHLGPGCYEHPWFTVPLKNPSEKHREWLADVTRFNAEMEALEDEELSDDEEQTIWDRRLAELGLTPVDLDIFSNRLCVHFSDGSVHRIGPTYYEDGDLRWRNGEALSGIDAGVDEALTWAEAFGNFSKALLFEFALQIGAVVLMVGLVFAWLYGWFG